ncbi:MAG: Hsp70 family protein [Myxococcales bacterium]|nr:Hsp70 family protein [Myxococcales bacterium]
MIAPAPPRPTSPREGSARFVVGIDLGTSNTVVAFASEGDARPSIFPVEQRVTATTRERRALLPSCAFAAIEGELVPEPALDESDAWVLGEMARRRGAEVPGRLVASSKSWLCHPRVDKEAPILPWGADEQSPKLSPVEAATRILRRIRLAWDAEHPRALLAHQDVVLTVPASFDVFARELTLRAAHEAGIGVRLLEEPQAAFYAAMQNGALRALAERENDALCHVLVCDVGGGTTDLSLLQVTNAAADPRVKRVAVGPHLLLGGDNMDLALAHALEPRLVAPPERLDPKRFAQLVVACRDAKEKLLGPYGPEEARIAVAGSGSALVGSTLRATLTRAEARTVVVDGFLPFVEAHERSARARAGLVSLGLPYERDVALTRHVVTFLAKHLPPGTKLAGVLLNGGVFRSAMIAERLCDVLGRVTGEAPLLLEGIDPDLAVAQGAATFGLALRGLGTRIEGGAPKSFFVGLGGEADVVRAVCVVPKGAPEGDLCRARGRTFKLVVGRPARFDLYTSDEVGAVEPGDIVVIDTERFSRMPPMTTTVAASSTAEVSVELEAELTPVGTLEIACAEIQDAGASGVSPARYRLAFDLRSSSAEDAPASRTPSRRPARAVDDALDRISDVYKKGTSSEARDAKNLLRELERILGERDEWTADVARALADRLLTHAKGRRRTLDHERVWLQLTGFCLRPGFGVPGDETRVAQVAPLFAERIAFPKEARTWQQFFICLRRVAAGLDEQTQLTIRDDLDPFVAPPEAKLKKRGIKPESSEPELFDLLSQLERVPASRRAELGAWILERTWTKRDPRLWAAIGRLGARVPSYASAHHAVSPRVASEWADHLLREKWADLPTAPRAAADLARYTGDRARDLADTLRKDVARRLEREGADAELVRVVIEVVPLAPKERAAFLGERLPAGLSLDG